MKTFKHYSFDLWMTLIRSDLRFKERRTHFFHQHFNSRQKSPEEVAVIFRQVDKAANAINEKTGKNLDAEALYLWVIAALNDYDPGSFNDVDPSQLYVTLEEMLMETPPVLYADGIPELLHEISQFATINLLSNTGFIKGPTLRKVLQHLGIASFFQFQLYSDETGWSKPNPQFFGLMMEKAKALHSNRFLMPEDIIHIGDNPFADVKGAHHAGITGFLVHDGINTLADLLNK